MELFAKSEIVNASAANSTATGKTIANTPTSPSGSISGITLPAGTLAAAAAPAFAIEPPPIRSDPATNAVTPIDKSIKPIADSEPVSTIKNFPKTISTRATGLHSSVSIVPRSFSPAVRSIAGYIAPVKHKMMIR